MKRILVAGSTAYDLLLHYDGSFADAFDGKDLSKMSAAFVTPHFAKHHGGTGANISWNIGLLGGNPLLVSTVGSDGGDYISLLNDKGIDAKYVEQLQDHFTATAILGTDSGERQIIFFHPGADAAGSFPNLADDREDIAYAIVSPRDLSLMEQTLSWCKEVGIPVFFDPGQQMATFSDDALQRAVQGSAGVFVNEYEWSVLSGRLSLTEESILDHTQLLIITRGEDGVSLYEKDGSQDIPACKALGVVNPTGAGDAFRAGFLRGLTADWDTLTSLKLGAAIASFVVEQQGTLLDTLDADELQERARQAYGEVLPTL